MSQQCQRCLQELLFYYCFKTNCYMIQSNRLSLIPLITINYHCALISIPATCLHRFKNVKDTFSNFVRGGLLCWMVSGVWYLIFGIWQLLFGIWYLVFSFGIWYLDLVFGIWYLDLVFRFGILVFQLGQTFASSVRLPNFAELCQTWVKICRRALPNGIALKGSHLTHRRRPDNTQSFLVPAFFICMKL